MKSETLMLLTTLFSILYFGLMKYEMSQPWDIIKLTIVGFTSLLFLCWLVVSFATAEEIVEEENK